MAGDKSKIRLQKIDGCTCLLAFRHFNSSSLETLQYRGCAHSTYARDRGVKQSHKLNTVHALRYLTVHLSSLAFFFFSWKNTQKINLWSIPAVVIVCQFSKVHLIKNQLQRVAETFFCVYKSRNWKWVPFCSHGSHLDQNYKKKQNILLCWLKAMSQ